jgi:hypothetical protein
MVKYPVPAPPSIKVWDGFENTDESIISNMVSTIENGVKISPYKCLYSGSEVSV